MTLLASNSVLSTGTSDSFQRVVLYTQIYLVSNNQAANQTTIRVLSVIADNDPNRGGFGTASWGQNVNGSYAGGGSFSYNFDAGQSYTLYNSNHIVTHSATGTASSSSYVEFNSNISLIRPQPLAVSVGATLTPYPIFQTISVPATAIRGASYSGSVTASNTVASGYTISSGALPTGLTLNSSTGAITGTPTVIGTFNFTVRATGPTGTGVATGFFVDTDQTVTVNPPTPVFTDSTVFSTGNVGTFYSDSVSAIDATSYLIFSGAIPDGLTLNTSTGTITGTPTIPGIFNFVIRATNVTGNADTETITITVLSGAKVWDGTSFVAGTTKVWDGTSFVSSITKVWNGSEWVSAS
jgi:hypothetical protein